MHVVLFPITIHDIIRVHHLIPALHFPSIAHEHHQALRHFSASLPLWHMPKCFHDLLSWQCRMIWLPRCLTVFATRWWAPSGIHRQMYLLWVRTLKTTMVSSDSAWHSLIRLEVVPSISSYFWGWSILSVTPDEYQMISLWEVVRVKKNIIWNIGIW